MRETTYPLDRPGFRAAAAPSHGLGTGRRRETKNGDRLHSLAPRYAGRRRRLSSTGASLGTQRLKARRLHPSPAAGRVGRRPDCARRLRLTEPHGRALLECCALQLRGSTVRISSRFGRGKQATTGKRTTERGGMHKTETSAGWTRHKPLCAFSVLPICRRQKGATQHFLGAPGAGIERAGPSSAGTVASARRSPKRLGLASRESVG